MQMNSREVILERLKLSFGTMINEGLLADMNQVRISADTDYVYKQLVVRVRMMLLGKTTKEVSAS